MRKNNKSNILHIFAFLKAIKYLNTVSLIILKNVKYKLDWCCIIGTTINKNDEDKIRKWKTVNGKIVKIYYLFYYLYCYKNYRLSNPIKFKSILKFK